MAVNKTKAAVRNYYVLPCCLLLLNLANSLVGYKAGMIEEPILRTLAVMFLVLFGASLVSFVLAPAITAAVNTIYRSSRRNAGQLGELVFLALLGAAVFWCYYQLCIHGPQALLPAAWRNPVH